LQIRNHVFLNIDRKDPSFLSYCTGQPQSEIPTACADVRDHLSFLKIQGFENPFRFLPIIALGVFKSGNILVDGYGMMFMPLLGRGQAYRESQ
jgi:hypothetical protein